MNTIDFTVQGISRKTNRNTTGYVAWNHDRSKYYIVQNSASLEFDEVYINTLSFQSDFKSTFLFRGRSQDDYRFIRGFLIKDESEIHNYIGRFDEFWELLLTRVFQDSVGVYLGINDVYNYKIFSNSKVIMRALSLTEPGKIVIYNGNYYFKGESNVFKPVNEKSFIEIV